MTTTTPAHTDRDGVLARTALHPSLSAPLLDTMNFLNEVTLRYPQAISFAPGRPYEGDFDVARVPGYIETYLDHLRERGHSEERVRTALYQYGETAGQIRDIVARMLEVDEDLTVDPASVVVTVGCQEAVLLTLRALFTGPDDVLLVDSPAYVGITGAAGLLDIPVLPVPGTPDRPSPEGLERTVREIEASGRRARCLYVVPDCSNPTGVSMRREARTALLDAAARWTCSSWRTTPTGCSAGYAAPPSSPSTPNGASSTWVPSRRPPSRAPASASSSPTSSWPARTGGRPVCSPTNWPRSRAWSPSTPPP